MGKRYDWQVTPQNTPHFNERRLMFLAAMGILGLYLIFAGIFLSSNTMWYILVALLVVIFAVAQYFDIRREMWTWGYISFWIIVPFIASASLLLWYKAYWWFTGYGVELIVFIFLAIWKLKRITVKPRRN